ncbi:MAG: hypothetical protein DA328_09595 [Nitrososphaeraceae archaeon]|nr:hypothetical protein [Nitrososphaeraceae archaeon]
MKVNDFRTEPRLDLIIEIYDEGFNVGDNTGRVIIKAGEILKTCEFSINLNQSTFRKEYALVHEKEINDVGFREYLIEPKSNHE